MISYTWIWVFITYENIISRCLSCKEIGIDNREFFCLFNYGDKKKINQINYRNPARVVRNRLINDTMTPLKSIKEVEGLHLIHLSLAKAIFKKEQKKCLM